MKVIFILNEKEYNFLNGISGESNQIKYLINKVLNKNYIFNQKIPGCNKRYSYQLIALGNEGQIVNITDYNSSGVENLDSNYDTDLLGEVKITNNIEEITQSDCSISDIEKIICKSLENKEDEELIIKFFNGTSIKKELYLTLNTCQRAIYALNKNHTM